MKLANGGYSFQKGMTMINGKLYKNIETFEQAEKAMNYIFKKGIEDTAFGCWVQEKYGELFPQQETRIDYSMLDHY